MEPRRDRLLRRCAEDDLADRRGLVVDVAELGLEPGLVERVRAEQPDLLLRREQQLDAGMRTVLRDDPPRRLEHHDDGRLVVRAENRAAGVPHDPVLVDHGLERPVGGNRVEVGAEEDRRSLVTPPGQPAEDVPHRRADDGSGAVLVPREPDVVELGDHAVGDGPLLAPAGSGSRRARGTG